MRALLTRASFGLLTRLPCLIVGFGLLALVIGEDAALGLRTRDLGIRLARSLHRALVVIIRTGQPAGSFRTQRSEFAHHRHVFEDERVHTALAVVGRAQPRAAVDVLEPLRLAL